MKTIKERAIQWVEDADSNDVYTRVVREFAVQELSEAIKDITFGAESYKIKNNPHDFSYLMGLEHCIHLIKERLQ